MRFSLHAYCLQLRINYPLCYCQPKARRLCRYRLLAADFSSIPERIKFISINHKDRLVGREAICRQHSGK